MKQILTAAQVSDNLQKLFPGKDIKCTEVVNSWDGAQFYIETMTTKLFIIGKMVWVKPSLQSWGRYCAYCNQFNKVYQKIRTKEGTMIPFTISTKAKDKERHEQIELLLIACGLKTKKAKDDDLTRLQQYGGRFYVDVYKMIKELSVIDSGLEYEQVYEGYGKYKDGRLLLSVIHAKGNFKFPIDCISGDADQDEQIQNIFLNLLGKPVTSKVQELQAA